MDIEGAVVLVTGAGLGIGRGIALEFARAGATVVCASIVDSEVDEVTEAIKAAGGTASGVTVDVSDDDAVSDMIASTLRDHGRLDVLINNAGIARSIGASWEAEPEVWWRDIEVNLRGTFLCCLRALPSMIERRDGIIINLAGGGYDGPNAGLGGYAASKAGIVRYTDNLAVELRTAGHTGVHAYAFWPGFVRSGMTHLLSTDDKGLEWLPHVGAGLEAQEDHPAEVVGKAMLGLCRVSCDAISGRVFSYDDDFDAIEAGAETIAERDLRQLRIDFGFKRDVPLGERR